MATAGPRRDIVVIGGSAGAVEAAQHVVRGLPAGLPAAVFVVVHIPATSTSALPSILSRAGVLPAAHAGEGDPIVHGRILIAPPDRHLLIGRERVHLSHGPREHGHRPSTDALFRSAARHHGGRVIGVVLSGMLGDGALGLARIVERGGLGIVQDPRDAAFAPMPEHAVALANPQHVIGLDEIAPMIVRSVQEEAPLSAERAATGGHDADGQPALHARVADNNGDYFEDEQMEQVEEAVSFGDDQPGRPSGYACPDCGGVLWEREGAEALELVCRIGHLYNLDGVLEAKNSALEGALWAAVRALEEQASLVRRLAAAQPEGSRAADQFLAQAVDRDRQVRLLRDLVESRN